MDAAVKSLNDSLNDNQQASNVSSAAASVLTSALAKSTQGTRDAENATNDAAAAGRGFGGVWGALGNKVTLFGGVLDNVLPHFLTAASVWHIAADAVIEFGATFIPAMIAMGAWGAVVAPVLMDAYHRLSAIATVSSSLGTSWKGVTENANGLVGPMQTLQNDVNPTVWEVYGDAMNAVGGKVGILSKLIDTIDRGVQDLAARATEAANSGTFGKIFETGAKDAAMFGDSLANIFGIIGNLLKMMPGIAEILLGGFTALTKVLEDITANPVVQWLGKMAIAAHGAMLWVGLLATGIVFLAGKLSDAVSSMLSFGSSLLDLVAKAVRATTTSDAAATAIQGIADSLGKAGKSVSDFGTVTDDAGKTTKNFGGAVASAAGTPIGALVIGVGIAAAAVGYLGYQMTQASSGAKTFIANINSGVNGQQASQAIVGISQAVGQVNRQIAAAIPQIGNYSDAMVATGNANMSAGKALQDFVTSGFTLKALTDPVGTTVGEFKDLGTVVVDSAKGVVDAVSGFLHLGQSFQAVTAYQGEVNKLTSEQKNLFTALGDTMNGSLSPSHGTMDFANALGVLNAAGVTANDSLTTMKTKIEGLLQGWQQAGVQGTQLGNAVNATDFAYQLQNAQISTLTGAYSTFISTITSANSAFDTFGEGMATLGQALNGAGIATYTDKLGTLQVKTSDAGAKLSSLSAAGLSANGAFLSQITNATNLYNSLQTLASVSGAAGSGQKELTTAMKNMVGQMLPMAKGNSEAVGQLSALAQLAGGPATTSYKTLSQWVGGTSTSMQTLNGIQANLSNSSISLQTDVKNLGGAISQTLSTAMSNAIFTASGGAAVLDKFATSIKATGVNSKETAKAGVAVVSQLVAMTGNGADAQTQFDAFAASMGLSTKQANTLWNTLRQQYLTTLAGKAGETESAFVTLATQMGDSHGQAVKLWDAFHQGTKESDKLHDSLKKIPADVKTKVTVKVPKFKLPEQELRGEKDAFNIPVVPVPSGWDTLGDKIKRVFSMHGIEATWDRTQKSMIDSFDKWWGANGGGNGGPSGTFQGVMKSIEGSAESSGRWIVQVWQQFSSSLESDWKNMEPAVKAIWDAIKDIFDTAMPVILHIVEAGFKLIGIALMVAGKLFADGVKVTFDVIIGVVTVVLDLLTGKWGAAWNAMKAMGSQIWNSIVSDLRATWSGIKDMAEVIWGLIGKSIISAFDPVITFFTSTIPAAWSTAYTGFMNDFWHPISSAVIDAKDDINSNFVEPVTDFFTRTIPGAWSTAYTGFMNDFWHPISSAFISAKNWISNNFVSPLVNFFTKTIPNAFVSAVTGAKDAFSKIGSVLATPVDWFVNNIWDKFAGLVNDVTKFAGLGSPLPIVKMAEGGFVSGGSPGRDSVPAMVMPGEVVVPTHMVNSGAVDHLRGKLPGFSGGGQVPNATGGVGTTGTGNNALGQGTTTHGVGGIGNPLTDIGNAISSAVDVAKVTAALATGNATAAANAISKLVGGGNGGNSGEIGATVAAMPAKLALDAAKALISKAGSVFSGGGGGGGLTGSLIQMLQQYASKVGWSQAMVSAWEGVIRLESGGSFTAKNPTSDAYGLAQFIGGPSGYAQYGGNLTPSGQVTAMGNYIKERYGNPENALAHEHAYHWYGSGGLVDGKINALAHAGGKGFATGGTIPESVLGVGMSSGTPYTFGEGGRVESVNYGQNNNDNQPSHSQVNQMIGLLSQLVNGQNAQVTQMQRNASMNRTGATRRVNNTVQR
jgi:phage-related protein